MFIEPMTALSAVEKNKNTFSPFKVIQEKGMFSFEMA